MTSITYDITTVYNPDTNTTKYNALYKNKQFVNSSLINALSDSVACMDGYTFAKRTDVAGQFSCGDTLITYTFTDFRHCFDNGDDVIYTGGCFEHGLKAVRDVCNDYETSFAFETFQATILEPCKGFAAFLPVVGNFTSNSSTNTGPAVEPDHPDSEPDDVVISFPAPDDAW